MSPQRIRNIVLPLCAVLLAASCSTTRRLGSDEVLYTGVKKILIEPDSGVVLTPAAESAVKEPLSVAPNNPLYSPYLRTPLPVGLWAYNYLYTPKEKGFKYWFYKRLAKQPVLISKVQPQLRTKVAEQVLENYGYFGSRAADSLLYRKRGRKAKVRYTLGIAPAWHYSSIAYPQAVGGLKQLIDSLQATSLLRVGAQYNLDSLTLERKRISQLLRNRGYYYFRPEYMEYLADTTAGRRQVALRLNLRPNVPQAALMPYRVGDVTVRLTNIKPGPADTLRLPDATVIARRPLKIRPRVLSRALTLRPGQLFTVDAQNRTQTDLNKLGIFRSVNLSVTPLDSLRGSDTLDVEIDARFDYPLEAALETDVTSKSNSFIGPGVTFRVSNNNLFRGGEVLSVKLNGSYEWQTGNKNSGGRSSRLNSYELGLNANLDIPRLLLPRSMTRRQKYPGSTSFQLGVDLMNRPSFFRLIAFSGSAGYNFQTSPYSRHSLTVFKLTYNKLLHTTDSFDRTMDENPAIAMSFRNQFVPSINYTYTFERTYGATGNRRFYWQNSVTSAGNLLSGILRAFGERQPQTLFGNRFSQFVKEVSEVKFYHRIGRLRQFGGDALQRTVLHRRCQQHPRLHHPVARPGQLPPARGRPQRLPRPDGRLQTGSQHRIPLRHHGAAQRSRLPRRRKHLAAEERPQTSRGRTQMERHPERHRAGNGLRTALRHQLPGHPRRPRHRPAHPLSEPGQEGLLQHFQFQGRSRIPPGHRVSVLNVRSGKAGRPPPYPRQRPPDAPPFGVRIRPFDPFRSAEIAAVTSRSQKSLSPFPAACRIAAAPAPCPFVPGRRLCRTNRSRPDICAYHSDHPVRNAAERPDSPAIPQAPNARRRDSLQLPYNTEFIRMQFSIQKPTQGLRL